jgi:hypothetical protein
VSEPGTNLDLVELEIELRRYVAGRNIVGAEPKVAAGVVTVADLYRFLEGRGLSGFDLVFDDQGGIVITPKIAKLGFYLQKVQ